jgi:uncharacterized membrane protein
MSQKNSPDTKSQSSSSQESSSEKSARQLLSEEYSIHFSGPLPPPQILERYEKTLPGAADRLLTMAEKHQDQRHERNTGLIRRNFALEMGGMVFAFIVLILFISGGIALLLAGHEPAGYFSLFGPAAVIVLIKLFTSKPIGSKNIYEQDEHRSSPTQDQQSGSSEE